MVSRGASGLSCTVVLSSCRGGEPLSCIRKTERLNIPASTHVYCNV
jgi:hypothetical protein